LKIDQLFDIVSKPAPSAAGGEAAPFADLVEETIAYLSSPEALQSLHADPYWPKWCSPWWRMVLLYEMGLAGLIPRPAVEKMLACFDGHYLKFFPFREAEIPEGKDPYRHIVCHCALGTMHQVLSACGIDVDLQMPWVRPWYLRYQLDDGGFNCDEAAYTRSVRRSSVVSSLPPLESVLGFTARDFTQAEKEFLDRGAGYLLSKRLIRSASNGRLIDESWQNLCFPRFYHYDHLRGLSFVVNWAQKLKRRIPLACLEETIALIDSRFPDGRVRVERSVWTGANTLRIDESTGSWTRAACAGFPLLAQVSETGVESPWLTGAWTEAKRGLSRLLDGDLIETGS
jgi:hypothetical protein